MGAYVTPANGAVVRGYLKVGRRMIVGPVEGVAHDGVDVRTTDAPPDARGHFRCLGPPGVAPVAWEAAVRRGDAVVRVAWPDAGAASVWPSLRRLLGLSADAVCPEAEPEPEPEPVADEMASPAPHELGSTAPSGPESLSVSPEGWPRASIEALAAARAAGGCVRTPVLHLPARSLAAALRRISGDLSPMIEIDGVSGLRPRDVVAARVALGPVALHLEGTVVTARGGRARLRLAIPTESARLLLEQAT